MYFIYVSQKSHNKYIETNNFLFHLTNVIEVICILTNSNSYADCFQMSSNINLFNVPINCSRHYYCPYFTTEKKNETNRNQILILA